MNLTDSLWIPVRDGDNRLLDLFCGTGGAAMGYHRAGFEVVGVDNDPKVLRHYPFESICADALEYLAEHGHEYDAIHASPVCKGYSIMHNLPWLRDRVYPLLILPTREMLQGLHAETGIPWVIENVMGARWGSKTLEKRGLLAHGMQAGWLCGGMFGLPFYRHRLFESSFLWLQLEHPNHRARQGMPGAPKQPARLGLHPNPVNTAWRQFHDGNGAQAEGIGIGHAKGWRLAADAMGIDWQVTRDELTQMVPPIYTEHVGKFLLEAVHDGICPAPIPRS